ncbi:Bug family tripartite tricarboxylate transporter substrate binding protein [Sphaerimonospora thailandensis]|uniref:C4-dicarboxylate ABC transporter substrate-binding protein n=1 Tax=Sphaerimonospora thailandensis TaxID=795644 RepID=A0A8J3RAE9_9ACTN|nr:tripartite tricarboxylate transporter substrate-binding protein [Sphaerimonospora thailandensis]GIH71009.1 C4-dicarboxylate ABC transporter substrate-binding protein [Sphaerimonospora thailandensis]
MRRRTVLVLGALALTAGCGTQAPPVQTEISLVVPGGAGGRGDGFARALRAVIESRRWARRVTVREQGDGAAALARFVATARSGDLMVADPALLGAAAIRHAMPLVSRTAPLARLAGEWEVLVAARDSSFRTFEEFAAALLRDPAGPRAAGGTAGGPEHVLYGLTALGLGADPRLLNYASYHDRDQAVAAMLDGRAAVGVGAQRDMAPHIRAGRLRPLAVSSPERMAGLDAPTLMESGVRLVYANWSGLVGAQALGERRHDALARLCRAIADSPVWSRLCARNGWVPMYLDGDDFRRWLANEARRTSRVLEELGLP